MTLSKRKLKKVYPSKKFLNLALKEKSQFRFIVTAPLILLILGLAFLFSKYAVYDRFVRVHEAEAAVAALQSQKDALIEYTANYNAVQDEYIRYSTKWMTNAESGTVPRISMLDLMEQELASNYRILDMSANGNVISLKVAGGTLEEISGVVTSLYSRNDVTNVQISSAANKETYNITNSDGRNETVVDEVVSIVITMNKVDKEVQHG